MPLHTSACILCNFGSEKVGIQSFLCVNIAKFNPEKILACRIFCHQSVKITLTHFSSIDKMWAGSANWLNWPAANFLNFCMHQQLALLWVGVRGYSNTSIGMHRERFVGILFECQPWFLCKRSTKCTLYLYSHDSSLFWIGTGIEKYIYPQQVMIMVIYPTWFWSFCFVNSTANSLNPAFHPHTSPGEHTLCDSNCT